MLTKALLLLAMHAAGAFIGRSRFAKTLFIGELIIFGLISLYIGLGLHSSVGAVLGVAVLVIAGAGLALGLGVRWLADAPERRLKSQ